MQSTREPGVFVDKEGVTRKATFTVTESNKSGRYMSMLAVCVVVVVCCVSVSGGVYMATKS